MRCARFAAARDAYTREPTLVDFDAAMRAARHDDADVLMLRLMLMLHAAPQMARVQRDMSYARRERVSRCAGEACRAKEMRCHAQCRRACRGALRVLLLLPRERYASVPKRSARF